MRNTMDQINPCPYCGNIAPEGKNVFVPGVYVINVPHIKRSRILAAWKDCELLETE